jgi:WD40 repeat protein
MPPAVGSFRNKLHVSNTEHGGNQKQRHPRRRRTILQEAQEIVADTKLPPMRFLSASNDGTVKLWDTSDNHTNSNGTGRKPSRTFTGHNKRVSSIAFVRKVRMRTNNKFNRFVPRRTTAPVPIPHHEEQANYRETDQTMEEKGPSYYFLTGSYDGTSTLWNTSDTACLRTYKTLPFWNESASKIEVTSIAYIRIKGEENIGAPPLPESLTPTSTAASTEYFVSGYKSGKARLWDLWSGACLRVFEEQYNRRSILSRVYKRNKSMIYSLCSMEDSRHFAAGSVDGSIKMWDIGIADACGNEMKNNTDTKFGNKTTSTRTTPFVSNSIARVFTGHKKTVNSVKCVSPGSVLLSGSDDKRAMLWSVSTGACLRIFSGHTGPIHDVAIVDQVTFLTASRDTTIMAWDAFSEDAFRTYESPQTLPITAVSTGDQNGCFVSGAEDGTIGLWIFSAVHDQHDQNNILGIDDGGLNMTCGWEDDFESVITEEITTAQEYTRIG